MKRITALFLMLCLCIGLCACNSDVETPDTSTTSIPTQATPNESTDTTSAQMTEPEVSLITVQGIFYCSEMTNEDGYSLFAVVFDYANDSVNRELPTEVEDIILRINDVNSYYIFEYCYSCDQYGDPSLGIEHIDTTFERYADYAYALNYGQLLGGADPVRMLAVFYANPYDLSSSQGIQLNVGDQTAEFPVSEVQEVSALDKVLMVEDNFETAQSLAAFRWRIDTAFEQATFVAHCNPAFGSEYSGMSESMQYLFNEDVEWGVSFVADWDRGFSSVDDIRFHENLNEEMPVFNLELVITAYPEISEEITALVLAFNELSEAIVTPNSSDDYVENLINSVRINYWSICDALDISRFNYK